MREVKRHNRNRLCGKLQNLGMNVCGFKISMNYLFKHRYGRGFSLAMKRLEEINPDYIFNTHFSTAYYSCEARKKGLIGSGIMTYCTDPVAGLQWDSRSDVLALSSAYGKRRANKSRHFKRTNVVDVSFLIRTQVLEYTKTRKEYKQQLGLFDDRFTILLADGAYGAGKLKETVTELLKKAKKPLNIIAVCGKNEALYKEFCKIEVPDHIHFVPYGFCDHMLLLSAACDLFIGKAGSSNLAEPIYFGAPAIVTFTATFVEKWICNHQVTNGCAVKKTNIKRAVRLAMEWAANPEKMLPYIEACKKQKRSDGPEVMADILFQKVQEKETHNNFVRPRIEWIKTKMTKVFRKKPY